MRNREYDDLKDDDLYALSKRTLLAADDLPPKSVERAAEFVAYADIVGELGRRMSNYSARELGLPEEP